LAYRTRTLSEVDGRIHSLTYMLIFALHINLLLNVLSSLLGLMVFILEISWSYFWQLLAQRPSPTNSKVTLRKVRLKSELGLTVCVDTRGYNWNPTSKTGELDRPQHESPTTCVITQQRFPTTFISLRFHSH